MKKSLFGSAMVFIAGSIWGFMGFFVHILEGYQLDSFQISSVRNLTSSILMIVMVAVTKPEAFKIRLKDLWCFIGTGVISISLFTCCYFYTISHTSMSVAAILLYTSPIVVMLLSMVLFKEKLTFHKTISLIVTFVGCVFVTGMVTNQVHISAFELCIGLLAGFLYALYSIFCRYAINRGYSSVTITLYTFILASVAMLIISDTQGTVSIIVSQPKVVWWIAACGFFTGFLPYLLYTAGLQRVESSKAAIISSVEPVVATICGMVFFDEFPDVFGWVGIVLVLGAIVILNTPIGKPKKQ